MRYPATPFKFTLIALFMLCGQALQAQPFDGLTEAIGQGAFGNLKAVVISQHGEVIYEDYFRGTGPDDLHQVQSITKSVGSALVGIAHRQGKLRLDQDLNHFFSGLYPMQEGAYQDKAAITVEQVLQQRHGLEWNETDLHYCNEQNPVARMVRSDDWYDFVLTGPMDVQPGEKFTYDSGASTLMSRMIRVATGMGPDEFARQELFDPLGIGPVHWEIYNEDGCGHSLMGWPNPDNDPTLAFSLWLRARDMLKIGELYLNRGVHEGRRILDPSWIDASWTKYSHSGNSDFFPQSGWGHGYQWWIAQLTDARNRNWQVFFASGWGSQVIFILPELGLVVVTVGDNHHYNGPDVDALLINLLPEVDPRLDSRYDGSWYHPDQNGQGFSMEIREDGTVVAYWYTYTIDGEQRWFTLQGSISGNEGVVTIYETSGGIFLQDDPFDLGVWGSGRFRALDCNHMELEVDSAEITTTIPLTRLSGVCFEPP